MIRLLLERAGYEVEEADNGRAGVERMGSDSFDLVATDVIMPELDGLDVVKAAKSLDPALKVLAISGGDAHIPAQMSLKMMQMYRADDVMYKPFDNDALLTKVDGLLTN